MRCPASRVTLHSTRLLVVTVRRLTALAVAAFMLHLNVVRADAACVAHEMSTGQDTPVQHDLAAMHASHELNDSTGVSDDANCETPAQQDCCQAMTSCGPLFGSGIEWQPTAFVPSHDAVGALFSTRPLSRNTAPEPPPPRL